MRESKYINSLREEGELRGFRPMLLRVLRGRLGEAVPKPIRDAIETANDWQKLEKWGDIAATAGNWAEVDRLLTEG